MQKHMVKQRPRVGPTIAVIAGVATASVVAITILGRVVTAPASQGAASEPTATNTAIVIQTPAPPPSPIRPTVLAIGDSVMKGYGVPPGDSWLDKLATMQGWNLIDRSCDGAGFIRVGAADCGKNFPAIVAASRGLAPDFVIISGSANDFGTDNDQLRATTDAAVEALRTEFPRATLIGLNVAWGDQPPPGKVAVINEQVAGAMANVHGIYLDFGTPLRLHPELMQADHLHPRPAGQLVLESAIEKALAHAGLVI
jgi:lysophospholipase L1-like esterase